MWQMLVDKHGLMRPATTMDECSTVNLACLQIVARCLRGHSKQLKTPPFYGSQPGAYTNTGSQEMGMPCAIQHPLMTASRPLLAHAEFMRQQADAACSLGPQLMSASLCILQLISCCS